MNRIATPSKVNLPTGSGKQVPGNKLRASALNLYQIAAAFGVSFTFAATLTTAEAGDILRGGAPMGAPRGGRGAGSVSEAGTARARANAKDALSRTTQAVQAVQAMQTAARGVARSGSNNLGLSRSGRPLPNVPNGLVTGGLQVAPGVPVNLGKPVAGEDIKLWQGAMLPSQSVSGGKTTVTIKQTSQQALLNWKTFNIGKETTLKFDQSKGGASQSEWIAFNKIVDPTGVPSQVLGSIEASGQVYVLNQNGIIFGGSSQVNTHALVASSLPINNGLVNRGLLNNPDGQFLFSARVTDPTFLVSAETPTYTLAQKVADGTSPSLSYSPSSGVFTALKAGTDYTLKRDAEGRTIVTATPEGIARIGSATLTATYSVPGGDVVVKKGAILSSPTTPEHIGGRISLFAPNVLNEGTILTPDGQTLLAAGRQIALVGHQSGDPSLRGLDVYVGVVDQNSGVARNTGLIQAPRASVGISGKTVDQLGTIDSSTSVSLNGRVDLLASYNAVANPGYDPAFPLKGLPFLFKSTGTVTLGAESITRIVPELLDTETVVGTRLALASKVNVQGHAIHLASNALLLAPNAEVTLSAGTWDFIPSVNKPLSNFVYAGGQIYLDRGATINVAGTVDVEAPMSQNILSLELRGAELADAPLQRTGVLRGTTLNIDIRQSGLYNGQSWIGTPLGNAAGFVNLIERNVAALTTAGGTVALRAGESVVMQSGAKIDVSGGWTNFEGGLVETTRVMSDGQILDISQATPDRVYQGIYTGTHTVTHSKYGISETFSHPLALSGSHYEAAYIQGANGGSIAITAPSMALDGTLLGNTISGPRQRAIPPVASALSLGFTSQEPIAPAYFASAPTPPNITFQRESNLPPAQPFALDELGKPLALPSERRNALHLSPELLTINGFGTLNIENSDGTIFVPANIELASRAGGSITLSGRAIDIEGSVVVPGGSLSFNVYDISPYEVAKLPPATAATPLPDPTRGRFTLGSSASLSTAGLIVDERFDAVANAPLMSRGGTIAIHTYSADLKAGGVIDVSGGVIVSGDGTRSYGAGGSLTINAGQDLTVKSVLGGSLAMESTLKGYSGGRGGSLSILAPLIRIGGASTQPGTLTLSPEFFRQGGFASYNLSALGAASERAGEFVPAIVIAANTRIEPVAESWVAMTDAAGTTLRPVLAPEGIRSPVSLGFNAVGVVDTYIPTTLLARGDFVMNEGASIRTDARGSVAIEGNTVALLGSIEAPAGAISVAGKNNSAILLLNSAESAVTNVELGARSLLSTAGTTLLIPDPRGYRTGSVLDGGMISVSGNIVAQAGSVLDVSGTNDVLDFRPSFSTVDVPVHGPLNGSFMGYELTPTKVESNAGMITLKGDQMLFTDATLRGFAGGTTALGGQLVVSSGRFSAPSAPAQTPLEPTLAVTQGGVAIPGGFGSGGAIGQIVSGTAGSPLASMGHFAVNHFLGGGFDALTLGGTVQFDGPVSIHARRSLNIADAGVLYANSTVHLEAPYVALGSVFRAPIGLKDPDNPFTIGSLPFNFSPTYGRGDLTVVASLIDIGNLSLQNVGRASLIARNGDIRGDGTLNISGALNMSAGQIYPPTGVRFTIAAYDRNILVAASSSDSTSVTLASAKLPPGFGIGSPLLGSTVTAIDGATVTLAAKANATIAANPSQAGTAVTFAPGSGSVVISGAGDRALPLSAGGTLSIYSSNIHQGGVLRAPLGTINLGWDGSGTAPKDLITGQSVPVNAALTFASGGITSVSAVDPRTGAGLLIPYGINANGTSWIDPAGTDITASGLPIKQINLGGGNVKIHPGSWIDIQGGGDLYAYRFVTGKGGTQDLLASTNGFAVVPGYASGFAPYAPFNTSGSGASLAADPGYTNGNLKPGDRVYLGASSGLAAGVYTLLPARYALLPGAFLVTPQSGMPLGTQALPDGSNYVSGYRFNGLDSTRNQPLMTRFEVVSSSVIRDRSQYDEFTANQFLAQRAADFGTASQRLPIDAGHLIVSATQGLTLAGRVTAQASTGGDAGLVDISSPLEMVIGGPRTSAAGRIVLDATVLSGFGAESLLIGGTRQLGPNGTTITVKTSKLTVDNAGAALTAPDIILVATKGIDVAPGALIIQAGESSGENSTLLIGTSTIAGSGDGTLLRVTSDSNAQLIRAGVTASTVPTMNIGAGAFISGHSLTLDSTASTFLASTGRLRGDLIALSSGRISLQFDDAAILQPNPGLILSGAALAGLESASSLSLTSYSTFDLYGAGTFHARGSLALHAAEIRNFAGGGTVTFSAPSILLDNRSNGTGTGSVLAMDGTLRFDATRIRLGSNLVNIDQFANVELKASGGLLASGVGGLATQGALKISAPLITGGQAAKYTVTAGGALVLESMAGTGSAVTGGLGASLTLKGASIVDNADIILPSGNLTLHATGIDGIVIGNLADTRLDVSGTAQAFYDLIKYSDAGQITLVADTGSVTLDAKSSVNVEAPSGGGNAGTLSIRAQAGSFTLGGKLAGSAGGEARGGSFLLDVGSLPSLTPVNALLNEAGFDQSRSFRIRTGDVLLDGLATSHIFNVAADHGSIVVTGTGRIDASGATGGIINLMASESVTLESGASLTVAAREFSHAGKGGAVSLEAGSQRDGEVSGNGFVDIRTGSTIDLSVAAANVESASLGHFAGTLHLRAPQNAAHDDLQVATIGGTILGASNILVEGYRLYTPAGGTLSNALLSTINNDAKAFLGAAGTTTTAYTAMLQRLVGANPSVADQVILAPGVEIINRTGNLTLGTTSSTASSDWNFSTLRYGAKGAAGVLTLRAAGNLQFYNALSDGFVSSAYNAELLAPNALLPANAQSWSYRLTAGADFSAVDFHQVRGLAGLDANSGSLLLGKNYGTNVFTPIGGNASTSNAVSTRFQVIRTGSGDIDISAGRDVKLLNQFATIYTAGTRVADPTVLPGGTFDLPTPDASGAESFLGGVQQATPYTPQYSMAGGNVSIHAQNDLIHQTVIGGLLTADSSKQLPNNWLYRRGYIDPATGEFGISNFGEVASTTWWVDFSNFFEGVGALGGGDVTLIAGNDVSNVDGLVATNARMAKGAPGELFELGGGDLVVRAGHDINGGVYYVERGNGTLNAGNEIKTNLTRSPSRQNLVTPNEYLSEENWLPTTFFLGKGNLSVSASGNVLMGPVANPFLLPGGFNNSFWYKTYFSTYAPDNAVDVTSLGGSVTFRQAATTQSTGINAGFATPILRNWLSNVSLLRTTNPQSVSNYQPWLRLNETNIGPFNTLVGLMPSTLRATAFSGDINVVGNLTLSPASKGTLDLAASGSINGLQKNGVTTIAGVVTSDFGTSRINLSDANPESIPGVDTPLALQQVAGTEPGLARQTNTIFLQNLDKLFSETGAIVGSSTVLQTKQALHGPGPLHLGDTEPLHLYAGSGDIQGITLFSAKQARILAGNDITDIAFYLQNVDENDVSIVAAGRDIVAYNANASLRAKAQAPGNALNVNELPLAGDIQISGPGTLEVLAGRNLDLGTGASNSDGTASGITSIGNARNPYLPFEGAGVIAGAGIGFANGLANGSLDLETFLDDIVKSEKGAAYLQELAATIPTLKAVTTVQALDQLSEEQRAIVAVQMFYLVLRDAGRSQGDAITGGGYDEGYAAIEALFPNASGKGDINTQARDIRTRSGGNITLFSPVGSLTLATATIGAPLAPPGVVTEAGGNISVFTQNNVDIGISRIFTLRGGNIMIWSSEGDIAAGSSAKTVQSAPPTRVIIDPQTADVKTDLAGLATGGGIGVLDTIAGVTPGNVDLIAPSGTVDAGDAGVRSAGNLNIAAAQVLNASNIQVAGSSSGTPASAPPSAPSLASVVAPTTATQQTTNPAEEEKKRERESRQEETPPSLISVEVIGYGGGSQEEDEEERRRKKAEAVEVSGA